MIERIIADYGFYLGWSFGLTAFFMILEPIVLNSQRKAVIQRLRRMARANNASQ